MRGGDQQSRLGFHNNKIIGKTGDTADCDKIEFRLFNSSSIFKLNITLREGLLSSPKQQINHGSSFCSHGASRLDRAQAAPWSKVEGHPFPGDEPFVTLAQLHSELSSRAFTTNNDASNNLQRTEYLHKMGWIKRNPRRVQDMDERSQLVGQQQ